MPFVSKLVLHSPISNQALLKGFAERCLDDGVSLLAIFGPGSDALEEAINWLVIGDGSQPDRFLCTSSHPNESLHEVLNIVDAWEGGKDGGVQQVRL